MTEGRDAESGAASQAVIGCGIAPILVALPAPPSVTTIQTPALRVIGNIVSGHGLTAEEMMLAGCLGVIEQLFERADVEKRFTLAALEHLCR